MAQPPPPPAAPLQTRALSALGVRHQLLCIGSWLLKRFWRTLLLALLGPFRDPNDRFPSPFIYRKIPKISPSKYKPLKLVTHNPHLNRPRGACTWKIALKYKVK